MLRHASLVMIFSDLLAEPGPVLESLYRLRHGGHDVILFHVLDEAEVRFPFERHGRTRGPRERTTAWRSTPTASASDYLDEVEALPRHLPPRVLPGADRLRAAGHEHAVRPGVAGVSDEPGGARMTGP